MDWLRSCDVHVVVLMHSIFTTDVVTGYSTQNDLWAEKMLFFFRYCNQFGIPVFFLISGMGAIYYDTEKKGFCRYAINKLKRLMIPMLMAIPMFILPRLYFSQSWDVIGRVKKGTVIEWNLIQYVPLIMADNITMKLGHLWFLPVLLLVCLVNYPLLAFSRRRMNGKPLGRQDDLLIVGQLVAILAVSSVGFALMQNDLDDFWYCVFPANLTLFCGILAYMGFQVYLQKLGDDDHGYALFLMMIGPIITTCINNFKYASEKKNFYGIIMMNAYHANFFAQGIVNQIWRHKLQMHSEKMVKSAVFPFLVIISIAFYAFSLPGSHTNVGRKFFYPNYGDMVMQTLYTTGTWHSIYGLEWIMRREANMIYDKKLFQFFTTGSLFIYLCHDMWITILATYIIHPNLKSTNSEVKGISFTTSLLIMYFGTEFLSNLTYYAFVRFYLLACYKKKRRNRKASGDRAKKLMQKDQIDEKAQKLNQDYKSPDKAYENADEKEVEDDGTEAASDYAAELGLNSSSNDFSAELDESDIEEANLSKESTTAGKSGKCTINISK